MTQELWENRGQKKTISFMYEGVAPSEAAFYSLFRRHHPNGPCVYRATDIELEVLESILAEKISKQVRCSHSSVFSKRNVLTVLIDWR